MTTKPLFPEPMQEIIPDRKRFKDMIALELITGFDEDPPIRLDIVPTMKYITHNGKRYFRTPSWRVLDDGNQVAMYLHDGYGDEYLRRKNAAKHE